jgi:cell division protease FtsH
MEKDSKSPSPGDKPSDKKPSQQGGGNLVWYMLGLGVLLLLMVTIFNSGTQQQIGWSDLLKLVEAAL